MTQPTIIFSAMNRQQKVTISGVVFHVEENCKRILMDQIELIHQQNQGISDERVAELLLVKMKENRTDVVCAKMVEQLLQQVRHSRKPD